MSLIPGLWLVKLDYRVFAQVSTLPRLGHRSWIRTVEVPGGSFPLPLRSPLPPPPRPFTAIKANKESQLCTEMAAAQTRVQLWPYRRGDNLQQKGESFSPWPDLTELIWKLKRQSRHSVTGCCQDLRQKPQPSNQLPVDRCRELNFQWRATEAQSLTGTLISQITFIPEVCINSLAIEPLYKLKIAF